MKNIILVIVVFALFTNINAQKNTNVAESVNIEFTTQTDNGQYSPRHVLAVWITNQNSDFVKTITKQAAERAYYLFKWKLSSLGNTTDAITGATLTSHQAHQYTWDCKDKNGTLVADGNYSVNIEFTDKDSQGPITTINFIKGDTNAVTPADEAYYKNMLVKYNTDISSVSEINNTIAFKISPNPASNFINISIADKIIDELKIVDINGKTVLIKNKLESNGQIDISKFDAGVYFISVKIANKTGIQKILIN